MLAYLCTGPNSGGDLQSAFYAPKAVPVRSQVPPLIVLWIPAVVAGHHRSSGSPSGDAGGAGVVPKVRPV